MAMVRIFEIICDKSNIDSIGTGGNYVQKWFTTFIIINLKYLLDSLQRFKNLKINRHYKFSSELIVPCCNVM
jgi:hypothetical protein